MRARWFTGLAATTITALLAGSALAQTGSGSGTGTPGPTSPKPAPSVQTAPGKSMPSTQPSAGQTGAQSGAGQTGTQPSASAPSTQPGAGQTGAGAAKAGSSAPMATGGMADAEQVRGIQKALQEKGMDPGPIDGVMGPRTQAALRAYQKDQQLPETGQLDAQTREKLGVVR